jgi:ribosomal protein L40E
MCFRPPDTTTGPMLCPECGKKIVSPNFKPVVCPFCKAKLPTEPPAAAPGTMVCPKCGTSNPVTAKACSSCGATEADFKDVAAPKAPGAPKMPGAPKPPSAPLS